MSVLNDNIDIILRYLDNQAVRSKLYRDKVLTDDEYSRLIMLSARESNEFLVLRVKKKGVFGLEKFMMALEETSHEYPGHRDVLEALIASLQHVQLHSYSAVQILHSLQSVEQQHSQL